MIKSISSIQSSLELLRENGVKKGNGTGFISLDDFYSIKSGYFTIVLGAPTHGKSEIIFELLIAQAVRFGKKSIILSPESGDAQDIAMELVHKYLGKSAYKTDKFHCEEKEFFSALNWVDHHFAIADDDEKSYSFLELTNEIKQYEIAKGFKFDYVMAEPWNELDHKLVLSDNSGRQDLAIEDELTTLRKYCKKEKKHIFLSFHPAFQQLVKDLVNKISYYDMPKAREAAGGQATLRKAFSWINIWRPPVGLKNEHGEDYKDNELIIQVEKSKPKGIGKKGSCTLFFDWIKSRYYEEIAGVRYFAFDHEKNVNINIEKFIMPISSEFELPIPKDFIIKPNQLEGNEPF